MFIESFGQQRFGTAQNYNKPIAAAQGARWQIRG
jgi:hypothetical protein